MNRPRKGEVAPNIAPRMKSTTQKGRDFEELIHWLEQAKQPGERVEHNIHVPDVNTDYPRQVDIAVRRTNPKFLLAIECRHKSATQDVTWVEEAYGRKRSLGADVMVLVSSSGFTGNAIMTAANYGIILRTYQETLDPIVISQLLPSWVKAIRHGHYVTSLWVRTTEGEFTLSPLDQEEELFSVIGTGKFLQLRRLVPRIIPPTHEIWKTVPEDGTRRIGSLNLNNDASQGILFHHDGLAYEIKQLKIDGEFWKVVYEPSHPVLVAQYSEVGQEGSTLWRSRFNIEFPDETIFFEIVQDEKHLKSIQQEFGIYPVSIHFRARVIPEVDSLPKPSSRVCGG